MKNLVFMLVIACLSAMPLNGQDYKRVDQKVKQYPKSFSKLDKLANQIKKDFKKPDEKARAIYTWIALHVKYDAQGKLSGQKTVRYSYKTLEEKEQIERKMEEDLATQTLKKKLAVCQGYSTLFEILCDKTGVECVLISGTSKTRQKDIGKTPTDRTDHAWNAVKINGKWKLIDVTWGAGYVSPQTGKFEKRFTDFYFFTPPEKFFLKHYPEDKKWLLTKKTAKDFANLPLFYSDYFETKLEIVEPTKGIIKVPKNKTIKVVIKNLKNEQVILRQNNERKPAKITPKKKGKLSTYELKLKSTGYLTIFVDGSAFATFKVVK